MATKKTTPELDQATVTTAAPAGTETGAPAAQPAPAPDATRAYLVGSVPIRHDDRVYGVGHEITLTLAQATRLGGLVVAIPTSTESPQE